MFLSRPHEDEPPDELDCHPLGDDTPGCPLRAPDEEPERSWDGFPNEGPSYP